MELNSSIRLLDLSENDLGNHENNIGYLCDAFFKNISLQQVNLTGNNLQDYESSFDSLKKELNIIFEI